jgi:hypothetical protein
MWTGKGKVVMARERRRAFLMRFSAGAEVMPTSCHGPSSPRGRSALPSPPGRRDLGVSIVGFTRVHTIWRP